MPVTASGATGLCTFLWELITQAGAPTRMAGTQPQLPWPSLLKVEMNLSYHTFAVIALYLDKPVPNLNSCRTKAQDVSHLPGATELA